MCFSRRIHFFHRLLHICLLRLTFDSEKLHCELLWPHHTSLVHTTCIRELHLLALIQNVLYSIRKAPKPVQPGLPRECKDRTPDIILSVISQPSAHYRPYRSQATILRRRQSCWPREQKTCHQGTNSMHTSIFQRGGPVIPI